MEDRSRRHNLKIRGVPDSVTSSQLTSYVTDLFQSLLPDATPDSLLFDRIHRLPKPPSARKSMKVLTFNVKGLNMPVKRHSLYRDLRAHDADIVCLRETHFRRLDHPKLYTPQYLTQYHSTFKTKARGVTLLIHNRVAFQMHRILKDPKGRYIILVCTINSRIYTLVSIYAPNAAQSQFLSQVLQKVTDIQSGTLVICGDLNMGLDPLKDRSSTVTCRQHGTSSQRFRQLLNRYNLYDAWRLLHPTERDYTFRSRVHNSYSRIDYFLIAGSTHIASLTTPIMTEDILKAI
uniref:exodeoxyribonuclease III n=1 Tax=Leptobrachium leishanense TaxID=445787 RepID=A0A8C5Q4C3_9ANUR